MTKEHSKKAGFSLIELLFAMLFMTVIVFGVIKLQTSNLTLSNTRQLELRAQAYVSEGLEIVDVLGYNIINSGCDESVNCYLKRSGGSYSIVKNEPELLESELFGRIIQYNDDNLMEAMLVSVYVEWEDSSGEHSVSAGRVLHD